MNHKHWQAVFWVAAAYNFLAGLPPLLAPTLSAANSGLPPLDPQHVILVQIMGLLICGFGIGYAMAASGSPAARHIVTLGLIGKAGVCLLVTWHLAATGVPTSMLYAAAGDFLFTIAFVLFLVRATGPSSVR